MESKLFQNRCAAAFTVVCLIVGFAVGYSLFKGSDIVLNTASPLSGVSGVSGIAKAVTRICKWQMIQFAAVFISGFTLFSYPVCGALLLYRGAACGYAAAMTVASGGLSSATLPQTVSYIIVTAILSVLAYVSLDTSRFIKKDAGAESETPVFSRAVSLFYLLLLTSGAAVFMKVLPLMIFIK